MSQNLSSAAVVIGALWVNITEDRIKNYIFMIFFSKSIFHYNHHISICPPHFQVDPVDNQRLDMCIESRQIVSNASFILLHICLQSSLIALLKHLRTKVIHEVKYIS